MDIEQGFSDVSVHQKSPRDLVKQISGPTPRICDSGRLGWDLRICISGKFPGDAAVLGTT